MSDDEMLSRIVSDSKILLGKPVIKGTRLSVEFILNVLAHGASHEEILTEYSGLHPEDIQACLLFAANSLADTAFISLNAD